MDSVMLSCDCHMTVCAPSNVQRAEKGLHSEHIVTCSGFFILENEFHEKVMIMSIQNVLFLDNSMSGYLRYSSIPYVIPLFLSLSLSNSPIRARWIISICTLVKCSKLG